MADQDFDLPSGAKHHVSTAPFDDADALTTALMKTTVGIQLGKNPLDMDLTVLKDAMVAAATSEEVKRNLFRCLERSTWNKVKVTKALFDDPGIGDDVRRDLYAMFLNVAKVNSWPFFEQAVSMLKGAVETRNGVPK